MIGTRALKTSAALLPAAGAFLVVTSFAACVLPWAAPALDAAPPPESVAPDVTEKDSPLDCQIVLLTADERKAGLEKSSWLLEQLRERPGLDTPRLYSNPLVVGSCLEFAKVEVENTSGLDFRIYPYDGHLFWVSGSVWDADNEPTSFGVFTHLSLKRVVLLSPRPPTIAPEVLKPGAVVTQSLERLFGQMDKNDIPEPGKYTVRAICSYFRAPDGVDCRVLSRPISLTITKEDIREWKDLHR